jgi:hypothetical protein
MSAFIAACMIVVATDRPAFAELYEHEVAHCNGWMHTEERLNGDAPVLRPPAKWRVSYEGVLYTRFGSTAEVLALCENMNGVPAYSCSSW